MLSSEGFVKVWRGLGGEHTPKYLLLLSAVRFEREKGGLYCRTGDDTLKSVKVTALVAGMARSNVAR